MSGARELVEVEVGRRHPPLPDTLTRRAKPMDDGEWAVELTVYTPEPDVRPAEEIDRRCGFTAFFCGEEPARRLFAQFAKKGECERFAALNGVPKGYLIVVILMRRENDVLASKDEFVMVVVEDIADGAFDDFEIPEH